MAYTPDLIPAETRSWIYNVAVAAGPLLVAAGYVTDVAWALWLGLIVAALGLGTASAYRPTGPRA